MGEGGLRRERGSGKKPENKICAPSHYTVTIAQINRGNGSPDTRRLSRLEQVPTSRTYILHTAVGIPGTELYSFPDSLADNSVGLCPYSVR